MMGWLLWHAEAVVIGCLILIIGSVVFIKVSPYDVLRIQSNSMQPTFSAGDMVVVDSRSRMHLGDVVAYRSPLNGQTITHRTIKIFPDNSMLQTQGDNLASPDSAINRSLVVGRVVLVVGGLGRLTDNLRHPIGFIVGVILPITIVLVAELMQLATRLNTQRYRAVRSH